MQKALICILVAVMVYTASGVPVMNDIPEKHEYPRYMNFHDGNGVMHKVDLQEEPDMALLERIQKNPANNQYWLYTRSNSGSPQRLVLNNAASITNSNFNPNFQTVIIVHGWLGSLISDVNYVVRDAYLAKSDVNVLVLDWSDLAQSTYATAVAGVPAIGRGLGQFLAYLSEVSGQDFSQMHLVGFSMGAHVVGNAGRELGGIVARITALDPAGPLFSYNSNRVSSGDAKYVEAIHTDGGYTADGLGIGISIADADFFPNGGLSQPGCLSNLCNHNRAWELFASTVTNNHLIGRECASTLQISLNSCRGDSLHMGNDDLTKWGTGMYRLDTSWRYPY